MGYYDNCLQHHGIKGMHWGVRRFENKGGHLTPAGKKRYNTDEDGNYKKLSKSSKSSGSSSEGEKKGLTDEQKAKLKKAAIVAGAATATALAAYGGYKLYQLNKKATEGLSNEYHEAATQKFLEANAHKSLSELHYSSAEGHAKYKDALGSSSDHLAKAKEYSNAAADAREAGKILQDKAKGKNYSLKDKVDYLKTTMPAEKASKEVYKLNQKADLARFNGNTKKAVEIDAKLHGMADKGYLKNRNEAADRATERRINKALTYNKDGSFTNYALNKQGIKTVQPNRIEVNRVEPKRVELNTSNNSNERLQKTLSSMASMNALNKSITDRNDDYVRDLIKRNTQSLSKVKF